MTDIHALLVPILHLQKEAETPPPEEDIANPLAEVQKEVFPQETDPLVETEVHVDPQEIEVQEDPQETEAAQEVQDDPQEEALLHLKKQVGLHRDHQRMTMATIFKSRFSGTHQSLYLRLFNFLVY